MKRRGLLAGIVLLACAGSGHAALAAGNDLREFRVGMPVSELPTSGYTGFACANQPAHELADWSGYTGCPRDARGLRAVAFRYDDAANPLAHLNTDFQGTRVGGHPVLIALLIGDDAHVEGIRIETDPGARLYLRKKAFLLANQVRARYGEQGWRCTDAKPTGDEEPIGDLFIKRHCEKDTAERRLLLDQELYRRAGAPLQDFVGGTQLTILAADRGSDASAARQASASATGAAAASAAR